MLKEHARKTRPRARADARPRGAAPAGVATPTAARAGRLDGVGPDGTPWVTSPGWLDAPARALLAAPAPGGALEAAVGRGVLLLPVEGAAEAVAIVGWIEVPAAAGPARELRVDGERVVIEAGRELELRCGEASITLGADGRVRIKGRGILNHAREVNRIRGGQVRIN